MRGAAYTFYGSWMNGAPWGGVGAGGGGQRRACARVISTRLLGKSGLFLGEPCPPLGAAKILHHSCRGKAVTRPLRARTKTGGAQLPCRGHDRTILEKLRCRVFITHPLPLLGEGSVRRARLSTLVP